MNAALRFVGTACVWIALGSSLGCLGRSPALRYYTMSAVPGTPVVRQAGELTVELARVRFPRYLERPQLVTRLEGAELAFDALHRWAGGFESNVEHVLAQDLAARLDAAVVSDPSESTLPVSYRVGVEILQFEGRPGGELVLRARWVVRETDEPVRAWAEESTIRRPVAGDDVPSLVAAHDAALGELADAIAIRIAAATRAP